MHACDREAAELIIDGKWFRFDSLSEFNNFKRRGSLKGIEFVDVIRTMSRLEFEKREQQRETRAAERSGTIK